LARKKRKRKRRSRDAPPVPSSGRAADAVTVFWMVSVISTLLAELLFASAGGYFLWDNRPNRNLVLFVNLMLFTSVVTGTLSLIVLPVVLRVRTVPPPKLVKWSGILIGALPLITILLIRTIWLVKPALTAG
jgi:hypothetical protein